MGDSCFLNESQRSFLRAVSKGDRKSNGCFLKKSTDNIPFRVSKSNNTAKMNCFEGCRLRDGPFKEGRIQMSPLIIICASLLLALFIGFKNQ